MGYGGIALGTAVGYLMLDTTGFKSGFKSAMQDLKTLQSGSATTADKFKSVGSAMTNMGGTLTKNVTIPLVGIGTAAVKAASEFESGMKQVQATLGVTADATSQLNGSTVNTMDSLSALAKKLGAETKFSASEAAGAINNMAMAGYSTQEIYDSLPSTLDLASAGMLDLDYATQLVANGLNVMGMNTSQADELADKLAVTSSKAYGSVSDFGEGLLRAGAQAKNANVSLTDTMTALGILGDNGLAAAEGGTALRNVIKNLYTPTDQAAKVLRNLGVETANSDGSLRDMQSVLQDLDVALSGMTESERMTALSKIFDMEAMAGANALLANSGERWNELAAAIDNADGAAQQMSDVQLSSLEGQLTILGSAIEGTAIAFGQLLLPVIVPVIQKLQELFSWLTNLDPGIQQIIVTIGLVAAAIGPVMLIIGQISTGISSVMGLVGQIGPLLTAITGPIGIVIAAVVALVAAWVTNFGGIRDATSEIFNAIATLITTVMTAIKSAWENDLNGIRTIAESVWNLIKTVFEVAFSVIQSIFAVFSAAFQGDWSGMWEAVKTLVSTIWEGIKSLIDAALSAIIAIIVGIAGALYNAATTAFNKVKEGFSNVWDKIKAWFNKAKEDPVQALKDLGTSLYNAAKNAFNKILDGFKAIWTNITNWVTEKVNWIKNKFAEITGAASGIASASSGGGGSSSRIGGHYASGLDYIPRDMNVRVHEGEAILTAQENRNRSRYQSGGDTFNFYSPEALTPVKAAREFKRVKQELALGFM